MNVNPYKHPFTKPDSSRTGLVSPATSLASSITPITPMTPLTTPRTPAQILLGRNELRARRDLHHHAHSAYPSGSSHAHERVSAEEPLEHQQLALEILTNFVDSLESSLLEIAERECAGERVIGLGIVRMCRDLAERVEELAVEIRDRQGGTIEGVYDLLLSEDDQNLAAAHTHAHSIATGIDLDTRTKQEGTISSLLLDTASSLRSISHEEAQELAEVGFQVAIMSVWTLRVVQRNMSQMLNGSEFHQTAGNFADRDPRSHHQQQVKSDSSRQTKVTWSNEDETIITCKGSRGGLGPLVEILGEEEKKDESYIGNNGSVFHAGNGSVTPPKDFPPRYTPQLSPIPSSPSRTSSPPSTSHYQPTNFPSRRRVLWPPILPTICEATQTCIHAAQDHPIPAVALSVVCGPAALTTVAIVGPPLLISDWAIQSSYNAMSETSFIQHVERAAANAFQVSRLAVLCSKLAIRRGVAVGEKQIERRGGVGKICSDVVDGAVDRVMHPVETVGMAWEGMFWVGGVVRDALGFVGDVVSGGGGDLSMDIH